MRIHLRLLKPYRYEVRTHSNAWKKCEVPAIQLVRADEEDEDEDEEKLL